MPKQGIEKQVPNDQRGRGMNPQHQEGQDNASNQARQAGQNPPAPKPKPKPGG